VKLKNCPLKVLYGVALAIRLRDLIELLRNRIALLGETTMLSPIFKIGATGALTRLFECLAVWLRVTL